MIEKALAAAVLDKHHKSQHENSDFWWRASEEFKTLLLDDNFGWAKNIVRLTSQLPFPRRQQKLFELLTSVLEMAEEEMAIWLVSCHGVDPDTPLKHPAVDKGLPDYCLTAYEYSIYLGLVEFESYLKGIGCSERNSDTLCLVIDALINTRYNDERNEWLVRFAANLLNRGANVDQVLHVGLFADAPRWGLARKVFRYDIFPRNSNMTRYYVLARSAGNDANLAALHQAMSTARK